MALGVAVLMFFVFLAALLLTNIRVPQQLAHNSVRSLTRRAGWYMRMEQWRADARSIREAVQWCFVPVANPMPTNANLVPGASDTFGRSGTLTVTNFAGRPTV